MVKGRTIWNFTAVVGAVALVGIVLGTVERSDAQPPDPADSTSAVVTGGYLHFPKILVHTTGDLANPALAGDDFAMDTVIQITNTSDVRVTANCFYVTAVSRCGSATGPVCRDDSECVPGIRCLPTWSSDDFRIDFTPLQPIGWSAATGLSILPCGIGGVCPGNPGQSGQIPVVSVDPFVGELRCIQVETDDDGMATGPTTDSDLIGKATIVESGPFSGPSEVLAAGYNAIGFQGVSSDALGTDACFGGAPAGANCGVTYTPCAAHLSLQHFFEGAETPAGFVSTHLTLSPCSTELEIGDVFAPSNRVVAQMLVYNEFEQRFSIAEPVDCVETQRLVDIDTPAGPSGDSSSIFSIGTQGTLGGQTRIRGVSDDSGFGRGIVGLAHQYFSASMGGTPTSSSAYHVNGELAAQPDPDAVYGPLFQ